MNAARRARADEIEVSLSRPCMLIVDDDQKFLDGARDYFTECGYDVDTALTPEVAVLLLKEAKNKYQLIVSDYDFGKLSRIKGDQFVRENRHLFGKAKVVMISGAAGINEIREKMDAAEFLPLEKNPVLNKKLKEITEEESQKLAGNIERVVREKIEGLTGRPADVTVKPGPQPREKKPIYEMAVESMKQILIRWLRSRGEPDVPVFAYGKLVFTPNEMIKQIEDETAVGRDHVQMLFREFEYSLEMDEDASRYDDDEEDTEQLGDEYDARDTD